MLKSGSAGADADGEGESDDGDEAGSLFEGAKSEAEIVE